jgi:hypothetical protein
MTGSFQTRALRATFTDLSGQKTSGTGSTLVLTGLRMSARFNALAGPAQGDLDLTIFGLTPDHLNQRFFNFNPPWEMTIASTILTLEAKTGDGAWSAVYSGVVMSSAADLNAMPEAPLRVLCSSGYQTQLLPAPNHVFPGAVDAATIIGAVCRDAGFEFVNDGVDGVMLRDTSLQGVAIDQIESVCGAADVNWTIELGTVTIWPRKAQRRQPEILLTPETGLLGYPVVSQADVTIRALLTRRCALASC